jgi:hypothetical protein
MVVSRPWSIVRSAEILGYGYGELTALTFQGITHPDDVARGSRATEGQTCSWGDSAI